MIDWTNAGDSRAEEFASAFVAHFDEWERGMPDALAYRLADPSVTGAERARPAQSRQTVDIKTGDQVTLGELRLGQGTIRIIGALAPMPTQQYYHPFGLANYALTYTGYQVLNNALN